MLERGTPWRDSALLGPAEEFFDVPLAAEGIHDAFGSPAMLVGAEHAAPQSSLLQVSATFIVDMPCQRWIGVGTTNLDDHERGQMLSSQRFLDPSLQTLTPKLLGLDQSSEFLHLQGRFHERRRDATLLPFAEFLTVDDDQRSIFELTNGAARSGGANVRKFSRQLLHRAAASSE